MNRILKFNLIDRDTDVPLGDVLAVAFQGDDLRVWVRTRSESETMRLRVFATGEECGWPNHVGTAVSDMLVFHVFRVK